MVRFLLEAGADQEHKTDEMHTALMEASMDGHVEVARLLLDSGAQVNMPADSFESPLTLAACGGHVELAMLLLERGANIEEVSTGFFFFLQFVKNLLIARLNVYFRSTMKATLHSWRRPERDTKKW